MIKKAPQSCEEGTAYWLAGTGQPAGIGDGAPLTLVPTAAADAPVTVAAPTRTLAVPDRGAVSDGSPVAADMLLPPGAPGLAAASLPATTYLIVTDGERSTFEALNAAAARVDPSLTVAVPDIALEAQYQFPLFHALLTLGTVLVLAISCAAIAVGSIDRAVERRREVALQAVVGVPLPTMRRAQLLQVLIPYGTGITLALGLAVLVGRAYGRAGGTSGAIPLGGLGTVMRHRARRRGSGGAERDAGPRPGRQGGVPAPRVAGDAASLPPPTAGPVLGERGPCVVVGARALRALVRAWVGAWEVGARTGAGAHGGGRGVRRMGGGFGEVVGGFGNRFRKHRQKRFCFALFIGAQLDMAWRNWGCDEVGAGLRCRSGMLPTGRRRKHLTCRQAHS